MANQTGTIRVAVTDEDIQHGIPRSTADCPIARALIRKFPNENIIQVGMVDAQIGRRVYRLPDQARMFVMDFDTRRTSKRTVKPSTFTLTLVREYPA